MALVQTPVKGRGGAKQEVISSVQLEINLNTSRKSRHGSLEYWLSRLWPFRQCL